MSTFFNSSSHRHKATKATLFVTTATAVAAVVLGFTCASADAGCPFTTFVAAAEDPSDVECLANPSAPACKYYRYSDAGAMRDMELLCANTAMPYMTACSVWRVCKRTEGVYPSALIASSSSTAATGAGHGGGNMDMDMGTTTTMLDHSMHGMGDGASALLSSPQQQQRSSRRHLSPAAAVSVAYPECDLWRLVKTTCVHDAMGGMGGCSNYKALCGGGGGGGGATANATASSILSCGDASSDDPASSEMYTKLPTTRATATSIMSMCGSHYMEGCSDCAFGGMMNLPTNQCDMLTSYATICLSMSGMSGCAAHTEMCDFADTNDMRILQGYCASGAGRTDGTSTITTKPIVMNMFFTSQRNFYLLFKSWVPQTDGEYIGAWFAIFFMGIAVEACALAKAWVEVVFVAARVARRKAKAARSVAPIPIAAGSGDGEGEEFRNNAHGTYVDVDGSVSAAATAVVPKAPLPAPAACAVAAANKEIFTDDRWTTRLAVAIATPPHRWQVVLYWAAMDAVRVAISLVSTFGGYLLMLAAMCFNGGIFAAVVVGLALGNVAFGYLRPIHYAEGLSSVDEDKVCHCC